MERIVRLKRKAIGTTKPETVSEGVTATTGILFLAGIVGGFLALGWLARAGSK